MFGIATLFSSDNAFPTRIYAATPCSVLFIEAEAFRALVREDRAVNEAFLRFLCDRVVYLNKKIEGFTAGSAERRLALYLVENACGGSFSVDGSYSALAQTLDIGRASLYRALDTLEKEGLIEKQEHILYLKNKTAMLEKYSRG
jgi:CRP-like cAMP-binding protein